MNPDVLIRDGKAGWRKGRGGGEMKTGEESGSRVGRAFQISGAVQ